MLFALGLNEYISFEALRENRTALLAFVDRSVVVSVLLYAAVYAAATALSLPWGLLLTIAGGFLFGPVLGSAVAVVAATVGAIIVFQVAKSALGDPLRARARRATRSGVFQRIERGFQDNALNYMFFLRLVPIFPFVAD